MRASEGHAVARYRWIMNPLAAAAILAVTTASTTARAECTRAQQDEAAALRKDMEIEYFNKWWDDLDRDYFRIEQTTCTLTDADHDRGGRGAWSRGDIGSAIQRLSRILHGVSTASILADLKARFGPVTIAAPKGTTIQRIGGPSLKADAIVALGFLAKKLELKGTFAGYLPLGTYALGSVQFEVKSEVAVVVSFNPKIGWTVR